MATLTIGKAYLVYDRRGTNDIPGRAAGDFINVGDSSVVPNGLTGTTGSATTTNSLTGQVFTTSLVYNGSTALPNQFGRRVTYSANLLNPWTLTFANGADTATATTPSLTGVTPPPFASDVTISGSSTNPTFTWLYPAGSVDGVFFDIFDKSMLDATGNANLVFAATLPGTTNDYTVPTTLAGGLSLTAGHQYVLDLFGVKSRDPAAALTNANSAAWSEAYFDFTPLPTGTPQVNLPTVDPATHAYTYHQAVRAGQTVFFDPAIAIGYTFATAAGDPNFASVLLPAIQTAHYHLAFLQAGTQQAADVTPGAAFTFATGGVTAFTVTGVDPALALDPNNATAFVTGLSFTANGTFNGTQTPITTDVPCFLRGTRLAAEPGEVPVEDLAIGDRVFTASGALRRIRWIGRRSYAGRFLAANPHVQPIRFAAGCLGDGLPRRDLLLSPEHALFLAGALVPAKLLAGLPGITRERALPRVEYVHIELDTHDVVLAEGTPCETFLDEDSRGLFANAHQHVGSGTATSRCAALATGFALEAIRHDIAGACQAA